MEHLTAAQRDRGDIFRRVLLGAVTTLVVARPLVSGEDPGRLHSPEAASGQILNLLWLLVALGGCIWLARAPRPFRLGGRVAVGLMIVALLVLLSAVAGDRYHHPAWLIFCEWAILPVSFTLARELTPDADPETDSAGGILSAILATGVSLAAFAIYQYIADRFPLRSPDLPVGLAAPTPPGDDFSAFWPKTVHFNWVVRGTLERSDTLAALLLLLIPAVCVFGLRKRSAKALWARAAALVMVATLMLSCWDFVDSWRFPALVRDGWITAGKMIADRPLLGVGPGSFDRFAARFQPEARPELLTEPWGAYPELLATCGLPALLAFVALAGYMLARIWRVKTADDQRGDQSPSSNDSGSAPAEVSGSSERLPRWEFYLGGVVGLLLGLALRILDLTPENRPGALFIHIGAGAIGRALVWFGAFSLFEGVRLDAAARRKALLVGLAFLLAFGLISGALLRPAVAQLFWVVAGLALAERVAVSVDETATRAIRWAPAPVMLGAVSAYLLLVCVPTIRSAQATRVAHAAETIFISEGTYESVVVVPPKNLIEYEHRLALAEESLVLAILDPQKYAVQSDPGDASRNLELAAWRRLHWRMAPRRKVTEALSEIETAKSLDGQNAEPLVREFLTRLNYAAIRPGLFSQPTDTQLSAIRRIREEQLQNAEKLIPKIVQRDPALAARLHFRLAQALIESKDNSDRRGEEYKHGLTIAAEAIALDERARGPRWRLTDEQREQLQKWLKAEQ